MIRVILGACVCVYMYLLLFRPHGVHTVGKLLGLLVVGQLTLHPDQVGKGCKSDGSVDRTLRATLVAVVALASTRSVPVPVDVHTGDALGDGACLAVTLALDGLSVLLDESVLVDEDPGVDGINDGLVEFLQAGLRHPLVLDGLQLIAVLTSLLGCDHEVVQRLQIRVSGSDNECVVAEVNGRGNESSGFGVGSSDGKKIGA